MTKERIAEIIDAAGDGALPQFYDCGICGAWHSLRWNGDCRDDANRFACDEIDEALGSFNWDAVEMPTWSGTPDPDDPDNYWIDDETGERVNAASGEREAPKA